MLLNHLRSFHLTVRPSSSPENSSLLVESFGIPTTNLPTFKHLIPQICFSPINRQLCSSFADSPTRVFLSLLLTHSPALLCPLTDSLRTTCRLPATTTSGEDSLLGNDAAQKNSHAAVGRRCKRGELVYPHDVTLLLLLLLLCLACRQKSACKSSVIAG